MANNDKKWIGAHVSASGGVNKAPWNARQIGANAFALFVKNQRRWQAPPLTMVQIEGFRSGCVQYGYLPEQILPHAGYLINLAHPESEALEKSRQAFVEEMRRCAALGLTQLNVHPGSTLGGLESRDGLARVADSINWALEQVPGVTVLIENTAGQGAYLGSRFEELADIIAGVTDRGRVGICLDTCHLFAAGYDLRDRDRFENTFADFEKLLGFGWLRAMHLNDSLMPRAAHVDRHAPLGDGKIGWECFRCIMRDARFNGIPLILETPEPDRWAEEIGRLRACEV
ncbi:MAG: deoxyribonuclease IV [Desulfuromonadaceae bacterium]|nr:deoxyribonuclease IV [Desulfuromonadaceae bacterium]